MEKINKEKALEIATKQVLRVTPSIYKITDSLPSNCAIWGSPKNCWYVFYSYNLNPNVIESSSVMCISKETGEILYNGSANDEG